MYNLGEEIILDSRQFPWLIWIQLLILFLLLLLLSYFGLFSIDPDTVVSCPSSKISSAGIQQEAGGSRETETERIRVSDQANTEESDGSSRKDLQRLFHPCYYLGLAKKAFLQCLGLGFTPPNPRDQANEE